MVSDQHNRNLFEQLRTERTISYSDAKTSKPSDAPFQTKDILVQFKTSSALTAMRGFVSHVRTSRPIKTSLETLTMPSLNLRND